ncbi:TPA: S8 family serine peptidase [Staphylococcus aureus]|uniref:S8 family peptidase n=1 Tax=Staphylococcus aureus TaxID=1280 RepID=UPI0002AC62BA|nr:S8 family peptidase [Staphylococcus aureus]MCG2239988.1 S8 family peptidase [Staphylococcus epidermidis]ALH98162.1 serine protease [Staphylococcus aureus]ELS68614.1 peptidase, S8/S53 family [Staphylococcus aureus subsp. aureus 21196]OLZ38579.1 serine protease [Staphylococcus aureus]PNN78521.1 serine protease [Staphylococcus aureus]
MNNILRLKGTLNYKKNSSKMGNRNLPKNTTVTSEHLKKLEKELIQLINFWEKNLLFEGALVSVYYKTVIAKSNRIKAYMKGKSSSSNDSIVGARFDDENNNKHIITHLVDLNTLRNDVKNLKIVIKIVNERFNGEIDDNIINQVNSKEILIENISKTKFTQYIIDSYYIEKFDVYYNIEFQDKNSIISLFDVNQNLKTMLENLGITIPKSRIYDNTTVLMMPNEIELLKNKAAFLVSMAVTDISKLDRFNFETIENHEIMSIPEPNKEVTIGVIDTLFDKRVYFSEWVEYHDLVSNDIEKNAKDYEHGTAITSILVDGPTINPDLQDNCGRFKVRHFGVAVANNFSSFNIMKSISDIVINNPDIKVWNLSLGSNKEKPKNFISPEASILDKIQYENDVIFIVSGTNKPKNVERNMAIGAPADSINSIVVNAVDIEKNPATYTREGIVLSFYNKPDVSCFGGDKTKLMKVCMPLGEANVQGTSFAAPWITRKVAYLIEVLGFSREEAKALIIDSATTWHENKYKSNIVGYGVVPIDINEIIKSKNDEIKFIISGECKKYETYSHSIPVPVIDNEHPYLAKATLCYFPFSERNQGVDYTSTELDFKFGRIDNKNNIKPIDKNKQDIEGNYFNEDEARKNFRKWDNVKHYTEELKARNRGRKSYKNGMWSFNIKVKERVDKKYGENIKFGVVIRLKEIEGRNRIEDFIYNCQLKGWLVEQVNVENRIEIHNQAEEEIIFD